MSTATLIARPFSFSLGFLNTFAKLFSDAQRYQRLFDLSDHELETRGLSRDGLARSYINGLGRS